MDLLHLCIKFDTYFFNFNNIYKIMAKNNDKYSSVKMSGYLEKKSKKMMSSWKSHWFVLEGHLLLYYRSKAEYDALGSCKGSVSLGPSCSVKPLLGTACVFQIETRSNTIVLKARSRLEQEKWMQAILAALNQNPNAPNGMVHFRYSSDDLLPGRTPENKIPLSRQHTLPERLKVEKRHTFCRSFDTLELNTRPKSALISNIPQNSPKNSSPNRPKSITVENAEYCSQDTPTIMIENTEYAACQIVDNTEYCAAPTPEEVLSDMPEQSKEGYYAISVPTEAEKAYMRKKSLERSEHIYERISGESRASNISREILLDNDAYSTAEEVKKFYSKSAEDARQNSVTIDNDLYSEAVTDLQEDGVLIDNDQYCTPDIVVRDTELVSYHEYNIPERDKDRHIYSVPNFDNTDLNDNRISRQTYADLNPYSVCHIYPKSQHKTTEREKDEYALYDDPDEYASVSEMQIEPSSVNKLLRKIRKITHSAGGADKEHTKKPNFLTKLFKKERKKSNTGRESVAEIEYAQIDEEAVKKMDIAYCIDKKLLSELELILQAKRRKLEEYLGENNTMSSNSAEGLKTDVATKQQKTTDAVIKPKVPTKPKKSKTPIKVNYENLQTIDEILNNLEQMKRNNTLSDRKVRKLIDKFDHTVKIRSPTSKQPNESLSDVVKLRSKEENETQQTENNSNSTSNDELSRLLNELAKVTNAPILTPGVTSSLGVTSKTLDEEFINLVPKKERRHSDPDYDIPRPHTNLGITKKDENTEEALTATRFFGPAMPNYEKCFNSSPPLTSITPDSLEISLRSANTTELNMASYNSHKYATRKPLTQKRFLEDEVFVDSLEPGEERSVI